MLNILRYAYISYGISLIFVNSEMAFCISNLNFAYPACNSYVAYKVSIENTKLKRKAGLIILHGE